MISLTNRVVLFETYVSENLLNRKLRKLNMELKLLSKNNLDVMNELVQFEEIDHALQF